MNCLNHVLVIVVALLERGSFDLPLRGPLTLAMEKFWVPPCGGVVFQHEQHREGGPASAEPRKVSETALESAVESRFRGGTIVFGLCLCWSSYFNLLTGFEARLIQPMLMF